MDGSFKKVWPLRLAGAVTLVAFITITTAAKLGSEEAPEPCKQKPSDLENGVTQLNGQKHGNSVNYSCDPGYELQGEQSRTCEFGRWTGNKPSCVPKPCTEISTQLVNGQAKVSGLEHGNSVHYSCNTDYNLQGNRKRTCEFGKWTGNEPRCDPPVGCGPAPEKENAVLNDTRERYPHRTVIKYTCNRGYTGRGFRFTVCMNGSWWQHERHTFYCQVNVCPPPVRITNGRREGYVYSIGESVRYTCDHGYENLGSSVLVCLISSSWSGRKPSCVPVKCPSLSVPAHGRLTSNAVIYQAETKVICDEGYSRTGPESRVCQVDKTWTGEPNTCDEIRCDLPEIEPVKVKIRNPIKYGSIAIFSCEEGKNLVGEETAVCIEQNKWSQEFPICIDTCLVPTIQHGYVRERKVGNFGYVRYTAVEETRVISGTKLYVRCHWKYQLTSGFDNTIYCDSGTWDKTPECEPKPCKKTPSDLANGVTLVDSKKHGDSVYYSCNPGYNLQGNRNRTCDFGTWTGNKPYCVPNYCPAPSPLPVGVEINARYKYGHNIKVNLLCKSGYHIDQTSSNVDEVWTCYNTTWKKEGKLKCVPKPCRLYDLTNGKIQADATEHGDSVNHLCDPGYNLQGDQKRTCEFGEWTGRKPSCVPKPCGQKPSDLENGLTRGNGQEHGDSVYYSCDRGYKLKGDQKRTCKFGRWTGRKPSCDPKPCEMISTHLVNGQAEMTGREHGDQAHYSCIRDYNLQGNADRTCLLGDWSGSEPKCVPKSCNKKLSDLKNGEIQVDGKEHGDSAHYSCDRGYKLKADQKRTCEFGKWTGRKPSCVPKLCQYKARRFEEIVHGTADKKNTFSNGSVLEIKCKSTKRFELQGNLSRAVCLYGEWDPRRPQCVAVPCRLHENITNGDVIYPDHDTVLISGAVQHSVNATVKCNVGYSLEGPKQVRCVYGDWRPTKKSSCTPASCQGFDSSGFAQNITTDHNDTLHVTCPPGHHISRSVDKEYVRNITATCSYGKWKPQSPECVQDTCDLPSYKNVAVCVVNGSCDDGSVIVNDVTVTLSCKDGYKWENGVSEVQMTCQLAEWDRSVPSDCIPDATACEDLKDIENAIRTDHQSSNNAFYPGDMVTYECHAGYLNDLFLRTQEIICKENGEWSETLSTCTEFLCGKPKEVPSGSYEPKKESYRYNDTVTFTCDRGNKPKILTCGENGEWDDFEPTCKDPKCPNLPWPKNGRKIGRGRTKLANVTFKCNDGFTLRGSENRTCLSTGEWSGSTTECVVTRKQCEVTEPGQGVSYVYQDTDNNTLIEAIGNSVPERTLLISQCKDLSKGELTGDIIRTCEEGRWSGTEARCENIDSKQDDSDEVEKCAVNEPGSQVVSVYLDHNGNTLSVGRGSKVLQGTVMLSRCKSFRYHKFTGDSRRVCQQGQWSGTGTEPSCSLVNLVEGDSRRFYNPWSDVTETNQGSLRIKQGTDLSLTCQSISRYVTFSSSRGLDHTMKVKTPTQTLREQKVDYKTGSTWKSYYSRLYETTLDIKDIGVHHSGSYLCTNSQTKKQSAEFIISVN